MLWRLSKKEVHNFEESKSLFALTSRTEIWTLARSLALRVPLCLNVKRGFVSLTLPNNTYPFERKRSKWVNSGDSPIVASSQVTL